MLCGNFSLHEILAELNWYGFQEKHNLYTSKASFANNGYENELFLFLQNMSFLSDISSSC